MYFFQKMFTKLLKGPAIGAWLYTVGGFTLPFLSVGVISIIVSSSLIVAIPSCILQNLDDETASEMSSIVPNSCVMEDSSITNNSEIYG